MNALAKYRGSEHLCAVCNRQANQGIGVGAGRRVPMMWVCSQKCRSVALNTHGHLLSDDLAYYERLARETGGVVAGRYLDELGKHDLRTLTPDEWRAFLHTIFDTYSANMIESLERVYNAAQRGAA